MQVEFTRKFTKQYNLVDKKIKVAFENRLKLFLQNPFHPLLNNHTLTGKLLGYRSINITGDWRVIYSEQKASGTEKLVIFEVLGTHSQLYR